MSFALLLPLCPNRSTVQPFTTRMSRAALPERWLRIHSLPHAKRYPGSDDERRFLLQRHNAAALHVLGAGSQCLLFVMRYGDDTRWAASEDFPLAGAAPVHALSLMHDDMQLQFFTRSVKWSATRFDAVILAAADDKSGHLLFANMSRRSIYAPYDGGADLIYPSTASREQASSTLVAMLSKCDDGL